MEVLTKKICNQIFQRLYYLISILAKPTALPEKFGTLEKTLFDNLVPVVVHQALAAFDARKKDIINREITRLKEATNLVNAAMASMNLPAAIESTGMYILIITPPQLDYFELQLTHGTMQGSRGSVSISNPH